MDTKTSEQILHYTKQIRSSIDLGSYISAKHYLMVLEGYIFQLVDEAQEAKCTNLMTERR